MTYAECHLDREHVAHGLCSACYQVKYRKDGKPRKRENFMPVFEPDDQRILPYRTAGVRQNATTSFPIEACPKCLRSMTLTYRGREARCTGSLGGCGSTVYLVKDGPAVHARQNGHLPRPVTASQAHTTESIQRPYEQDPLEV